MVLACKIFKLKENLDLDTIAVKIKDHEAKKSYRVEDKELELLFSVKDLKLKNNLLYGVYSFDKVILLNYRGKVSPTVKTYEVPFYFYLYQGEVYLIVVEKKERANLVANELSKLIFITSGKIVEARIEAEVLRKYHEENFEDSRVVFFDDVDIPSIEKLSLYGSELSKTSLYEDYLKHGKIWYVVVRSKKYNYVVGITRNCIVTMFSKVGIDELRDYVIDEVLPLVKKS
ncbi:hypothetical protein HRbin06_00888 [archaeon HR06]|nr:hypothetical protein HRbin06_00888 [archaeon HR06]